MCLLFKPQAFVDGALTTSKILMSDHLAHVAAACDEALIKESGKLS